MDETVSAIANILNSEQPEPEQPQQVEQTEAPAEENAQVEGEEQQSPAEIPLDALEAIEVEVKEWAKDGDRKQSKRTIKELREGYMRLDDYSRNIQDVARQREELGERARQAIESGLSAQYQQLETLKEAVVSIVAPDLKDMNQLAESDPAGYVVKLNRAQQVENVLRQIQDQQQEIASQRETHRSQAQNVAARRAVETLEAKIPGWNDNLYRELMSAGKDYGYNAQEVGSWVDARAIQVLHDAVQYRKLQSGKLSDKKVVVAPKVIRPGAAVSQSQVRQGEAMKRLQDSGRVEDAAAVIRQRLGA